MNIVCAIGSRRHRVLGTSISVAALLCFGLSGCVSSLSSVAQLQQADAPIAIEENPDSLTIATLTQDPDNDEFHLPETAEEFVVAIPTLSPLRTKAPVNSQLAQNSALPTPTNSNELALASEPARAEGAISTNTQPIATPPPVIQNKTITAKRPSFLARLFKRPKRTNGAKIADDRGSSILKSSRTASASNRGAPRPAVAMVAMPGVKSNAEIFGITPANSQTKNTQNPVQVASISGLARLSPLGLRTQHSGVNVNCIRPEVLRLINVVQRHYGKQPIVTSGYRSPSRNRKAGGARNSMHIYCKAVDIQVEGVSKWNLAKFLRTVPGRGGVGTYCRTKSVHIDIGPKRDWHYSCRRKSKRRRKA